MVFFIGTQVTRISLYTKTGLVFGFSKNQSLVAVILGQSSFWILSENYFEMSIIAGPENGGPSN